MKTIQDLVDEIPDPVADWTDDHKPNPLAGVVTERDSFETKIGGEFVVIHVVTDDDVDHRVPLGRTDLKSLADVVQVGHLVAIKFWGEQGKKFVYTSAHSDGTEKPKPKDPTDVGAPPPTDRDELPPSDASSDEASY